MEKKNKRWSTWKVKKEEVTATLKNGEGSEEYFLHHQWPTHHAIPSPLESLLCKSTVSPKSSDSPTILVSENPFEFNRLLSLRPICASCAAVNLDVGYVGFELRGSFWADTAYALKPLEFQPCTHFRRYVASLYPVWPSVYSVPFRVNKNTYTYIHR